MAEGDGAAIGIDLRIIVGDPKQAEHSETLRSEGLVWLDHVKLVEREA